MTSTISKQYVLRSGRELQEKKIISGIQAITRFYGFVLCTYSVSRCSHLYRLSSINGLLRAPNVVNDCKQNSQSN